MARESAPTARRLLLWTLLLSIGIVAQSLPADVTPAALHIDEKERDSRERLQEIIEALAIKQGSVVADVGTGYGYYAVRFSPVVGPSSRVYAEEIDDALVRRLRRRIQVEKLMNVQPVLGKPDDPGLPVSGLDAVLRRCLS